MGYACEQLSISFFLTQSALYIRCIFFVYFYHLSFPMSNTLYFYVFNKQLKSLCPNWCELDIIPNNAIGGGVTGSYIRTLIAQHPVFLTPPSKLHLVLHDVSSDQFAGLCECITNGLPIDWAQTKAVPRISSFNTIPIPTNNCQFVMVLDSPDSSDLPSTPLTLQSIPPEQQLIEVQFSKQRRVAISAKQLLFDTMVYYARLRV